MPGRTHVSSASRGVLAGLVAFVLSATPHALSPDGAPPRPGESSRREVPQSLTLSPPAPAVRGHGDAVIEYELKSPEESVSIEFLDAGGVVIRRVIGSDAGDTALTGTNAKADAAAAQMKPVAPTRNAGSNRYMWDLRYEGATAAVGTQPADALANAGPLAVPGTYQVRVTAGEARATRPLVIEMDPRLGNATAADFQSQFELAIQVRDATSRANQAVNRIRDIKAQIAERVPKARSPVIGLAADATTRALGEVERELVPVPARPGQKSGTPSATITDRLAALRRTIEGGDARPADAARTTLGDLSSEQEVLLKRLAGIEANHLVAFNQLLTNGGLEPLNLGAPAKP